MPHLVADCPICKSRKITLDVLSHNEAGTGLADWQIRYQISALCQECLRSTTWLIELNDYALGNMVTQQAYWKAQVPIGGAFRNLGFQNLADFAAVSPPEHLDADIAKVFDEAAKCVAVQCYNAASAMFRLCLDLSTKRLLPAEGDVGPQPNRDQRNRLYDRLNWLFEIGKLPPDLKDLADTIRLHGNDGAHDGTCSEADAADLLEFTLALLERAFTLPARVELARARAIERRTQL
jgi:hypothetical protein